MARLREGARLSGRESACDALLNLSATDVGQATIVANDAALGALVALCLCNDVARAPPSAQATAMAVLVNGLFREAHVPRVEAAGALHAAVRMLRRDATTRAGRERAIGLILVLSIALPAGSRALTDAGCVECLHELYTRPKEFARLSAQARQSCTECLAHLAQRTRCSTSGARGRGREASDDEDACNEPVPA